MLGEWYLPPGKCQAISTITEGIISISHPAPPSSQTRIPQTSSPLVDKSQATQAALLQIRRSEGRPIQLMAAAKVRIIRYVKIRSTVNPYDPKWELYLEARLGWQLTQTRTGSSRMEYLWKRQEGRCVVCGQPLRIAEDDCQIHHRIWRSQGGSEMADN